MKKDTFKSVLYCLLAALPIVLLVSCAHIPDLIGRWQEIGKKATLEFRRDGTFNALDDMGMAVSGKYTLYKNDNIRFEIKHQDASTEIIKGKITVRGDELILTSEDDKEVMTCKRAK
jgi:hypothetical protein